MSKRFGGRAGMLGGVAMAMAIGACDDGEETCQATPTNAPFELAGTWSSGFGDEKISDTRWDGFCLQTIESLDNDANVAILKTTGGQDCGSGYSLVVWGD